MTFQETLDYHLYGLKPSRTQKPAADAWVRYAVPEEAKWPTVYVCVPSRNKTLCYSYIVVVVSIYSVAE